METVAESDRISPVEPQDIDPALIAEGKTLFEQACAACHGQDGEGVANLGVSLTDSEVVLAHEETDVLDMIREGRMPGDAENTSGGVMPASGGRPDLTDEQLLAIVAYLRSKPSEMQ
ncbi:MAG: cytochrome c [Caldilineaceae bacterium]